MTNLSGANLNNGAAVGPQGEGRESVSTFPKYPEYKDSGVEWLGAVPTYWESWKISHAFGELGSGTTPPTTEAEWYDNGTVPWVTTGELRESVIWETKKLLAPTALSAFSALRLHPAGSLVIAMYGATIGRLGILGVDAATNQACCLLARPNKLHIKFTFYWLLVFKQSIIDLYASGGGQPNINQEIIANLKIPAPGVLEQTQIARFLDHETARIDALIEEQRRLIELLKEKRQAFISHAVTKGLDPTVPMKDSGVEWLGEVPAHWVVAGLKRFWSVTDCKHITAEFVDEGIPLASIREVQSRYVDLDNAKQTTEVFYRQLIEGGRELVAGDLIFSRNATVGEVAQVANWHPPFAMGQDVCVLKKQYQWLSSDYLQAVLRSPVVIVQLDNLMIGSTFKRVNVEDIRGLVVPMPPEKEQKLIADYLNSETGKFDSLLAECRGTIGLLQERRSALISAAVTGKIDVRGWQPPASIQAPESAVAEAV
ncbi:restriction endonuclease subunit S [Metapseudomonas otitidis]|uniref:restriction endonuclease subunit S n=1 Tax=Metapseudomonas otitidis TaxID=319939 RepID=UPI00209BA119|nr:restriction endonuclease subunit S [Pseudomonas otitidis]MCO7557789.1 restriction endonuclease subunit S [Pseudomonas otitidis]